MIFSSVSDPSVRPRLLDLLSSLGAFFGDLGFFGEVGVFATRPLRGVLAARDGCMRVGFSGLRAMVGWRAALVSVGTVRKIVFTSQNCMLDANCLRIFPRGINRAGRRYSGRTRIVDKETHCHVLGQTTIRWIKGIINGIESLPRDSRLRWRIRTKNGV